MMILRYLINSLGRNDFIDIGRVKVIDIGRIEVIDKRFVHHSSFCLELLYLLY